MKTLLSKLLFNIPLHHLQNQAQNKVYLWFENCSEDQQEMGD